MPRLVFLDSATVDADGDMDFTSLAALGELVRHPITRPEDAVERLASAEIALSNKVYIGAEAMDAAPDLKLIQVTATGTNNVDLDAAKARGIPVCNVSGYSTPGVVQHTFALILNLMTKVDRYASEASEWPQSEMFCRLDHPIGELAGKTLGIAGLGSIGGAVAEIGKAFGMNIVALGRDGAALSGSVPRLPRDEFFATADVISLHCPLTPDTENLINAETLGQMKSSALLINTGRGPLIDEPALAEALKNDVIAGAGLDVLSAEPPPADNPLIVADLPNLLVTPHTAWASIESRNRLMKGIVQNLTAFLAGETDLPNRVA